MIIINDNEVKQECGIWNHITHIKFTEGDLGLTNGIDILYDVCYNITKLVNRG